uniref:Uncharacterized protein n=1 Tax=Solanum lycopersicum TaxID=4081 RepID=A0A3Q7EAI0_SOLLC
MEENVLDFLVKRVQLCWLIRYYTENQSDVEENVRDDTDRRAFSSSIVVDQEQDLTYPFYAFEKVVGGALGTGFTQFTRPVFQRCRYFALFYNLQTHLVRPQKKRNPDVDFLSFLSFAQSESEKPQSSKSPGRMSKPRPIVPKMYLRMRFRLR